MIKINNIIIEPHIFASGETQINLPEEMIFNKNTTIQWFYRGDNSILELLQTLSIFNSYEFKLNNNINHLSLIINYMPYARMDRTQSDKQAFSLKLISDMINSLTTEFDEIKVLEPHSNKTLELLNKSTQYHIFNEKTLVELGFDLEIDILAFPDKGAKERYAGRFPNVKTIIQGEKVRDFNTGQIKALETKFVRRFNNSKNSNIWVLDDICSYGNTFIKLKENLPKEVQFKDVFLVVTHLENAMLKGEVLNHFNKIYTTNSIFTEKNNQVSIIEL